MKRNHVNFVVDAATLALMLGMIVTGVLIRYVLPPGSGGGGGGRRLVLWGWDRHDWGGFHFWLAASLGVVLTIHVILHWAWVCGTAHRLLSGGRRGAAAVTRRTRAFWGAGFVGAVLAMLIAFFWVAGHSTRYVASAAAEHAGSQGEAQRGSGADRQVHADGDRPGIPSDGDGCGSEAGTRAAPASRGRFGATELTGTPDFIRGSMTLGEAASASGVPVETIRSELRLPDSVSRDERLGRLSREYGFELSDLRNLLSRPHPGPPGTSR